MFFFRRGVCLAAFAFLFMFRYVRMAMNHIYSRMYKPTPIPASPTYHASDLTLIQCTRATDIFHSVFMDSVRSFLRTDIAALFISTAGYLTPEIEDEFLGRIQGDRTRVKFFSRAVGNRREQTALAVPHVKTRLLMLIDDHTPFLENPRFLPTLLAPFEDPKLGAVVPGIEVKNHHHFRAGQRTLHNFWLGFWNVLACWYLRRWYWEYKSTVAFEKSISCLSSRCNVDRSEIFCDPKFQHHYLNEYIHPLIPSGINRHGFVWADPVGPLHPSDDACLTRWIACEGYDVTTQAGPDSTLVTELGTYSKYKEQYPRWNRSKFQSCPNVLWYQFSGHKRYPYLIYTDGICPYFRMSLFYEDAMLLCAYLVLRWSGSGEWSWTVFWGLNIFFTAMKLSKIWGHFEVHGYGDLVFFPFAIIFSWGNSPFKIYWNWTRADGSWGSAEGGEIEKVTDEQLTHLLASVEEK